MNEKVIELSKTKIALVVLGSLGFLVLASWLFTIDPATVMKCRRYRVCLLLENPALFYSFTAFLMIFASCCSAYSISKLFDKKPGLILNEEGLIDNSSGVAVGLIPWSEIVGFETFESTGTKMLIIKLINPEQYIQNGNFFKRFLNQINHQMAGSPISISSTALNIGFNELKELCDYYHELYGTSSHKHQTE